MAARGARSQPVRMWRISVLSGGDENDPVAGCERGTRLDGTPTGICSLSEAQTLLFP